MVTIQLSIFVFIVNAVIAKECYKPGQNANSKRLIGKGIDATTFQPMAPNDQNRRHVIQLTCDKNTIVTSPIEKRINYSLPDQIASFTVMKMNTEEINVDFHENMESVKRGFWDELSVTGETNRGMFVQNSLYVSFKKMILDRVSLPCEAEAKIAPIQAKLMPHWELEPSQSVSKFVENMLPKTFEENPAAYMNFIELFGTHYVSEVFLAGVMRVVIEIPIHVVYRLSRDEIINSCRATLSNELYRMGCDYDYMDIDPLFEKRAKTTFKFYGGETDLHKEGLDRNKRAAPITTTTTTPSDNSADNSSETTSDTPSATPSDTTPTTETTTSTTTTTSIKPNTTPTTTTTSTIPFYVVANKDARMNCYEWTKQVAANPWIFSAKLVPISTLIRQPDKRKALERATNVYLNKKYLKDVLISLRKVAEDLGPEYTDPRIKASQDWIKRLLNKASPTKEEVDKVGKVAEKLIYIPNWFQSSTELCYYWTTNNNGDQCVAQSRNLCTRVNDMTPPFYMKPNKRNGTCIKKWAIISPYAEDWFKHNVQLCFKWTSTSPESRCGVGTPAEVCAPVNGMTMNFVDSIDAQDMSCSKSWQLRVPPGFERIAPIWFLRVKLCVEITPRGKNPNCALKPSGMKTSCTPYNVWTDYFVDNWESDTGCSVSYGLRL